MRPADRPTERRHECKCDDYARARCRNSAINHCLSATVGARARVCLVAISQCDLHAHLLNKRARARAA